jgi:Mce-associated membrane protein
MPPWKRPSAVLNGDARDAPTPAPEDQTPGPDDALALAEEAEAEAVAAEAAATAARARARALKLRRQAEAAAAVKSAVPAKSAVVGASAPVGLVTPRQTAEPEAEPEVPAADQQDVEPDDLGVEGAIPNDAVLDDADAVPARRRRPTLPHVRLKWVAAAVVVLCTIALLVVSVLIVAHHRSVQAEQQRSAEFAAAARQGVVTLMSLNFNRAQDDVKRIIDNTTGDFRTDFQGQADEFTKVAQASKVITEATVNATAVQSMSKDTATVLVAVTTSVSNVASKEQQPRSWRLRVDMARDGGQLKLAKVEFVP